MHEIAGVHRELFAENSDLYGEDVRIKVERCLSVTDTEAERARACARSIAIASPQPSRASTSCSRRPCPASRPGSEPGASATSTCARRS